MSPFHLPFDTRIVYVIRVFRGPETFDKIMFDACTSYNTGALTWLSLNSLMNLLKCKCNKIRIYLPMWKTKLRNQHHTNYNLANRSLRYNIVIQHINYRLA